MRAKDKKGEQLIDELVELRQRIAGSVTEHKRLEEALVATQARLQHLLAYSSVVIYACELAGDRPITVVSENIQMLLGYEPRELVDDVKFWATHIHPEDVPVCLTELSRLVEQGHNTLEYRIRHKDGTYRWVCNQLTVVRDADGNPLQTLGYLVDITKYKQIEEERYALLNRESKLRQKLEAEMKGRADFARALVHELKTPLTPVLASSELLIEQLREEPLLGLAKNINRGASNLNKRIDELLDLVRGEIGILHLKLSPIDPSQLLNKVVNCMIPVASSHRQCLTLDLPPFLPLISADEERIEQVVLNLLSNACKFTPEGTRITLRADEKDASLTVEVEDSGQGIAEKEQRRLFKPYFHVGGDREHPYGVGLGLALCKRLVELHGGQIWAKSIEGRGSTFGFSLPLEAASGREEGSERGPER